MENTRIESINSISKAQRKVCRRCVQIQNVIEVNLRLSVKVRL